MSESVVLIHTVPALIEVFNRLGAEWLPGVRFYHILDEPLLERVRRRETIDEADVQRLCAHVEEAAAIEASAVLVTCSTISPCVDGVRPQTTLPIVKIDEAMIGEAVRLGTRIIVFATNRTTLQPTRMLLERRAAEQGKPIEIVLIYVPNALDALQRGDGPAHDQMVREAVFGVEGRADVVVLAQASMARVLDTLPPEGGAAPILSSPHLALAELAAILRKRSP